jgi:broad specificity phosphatase PhoE/predicted nucleotidyltransferase
VTDDARRAEREDADLRDEATSALWRAADRLPYILSATLTGSFAEGRGICDVSDIDVIVIVDRLDGPRFAELRETFRGELEPVLARRGLGLRLNMSLGPLKFNDERTAVLHLMVYTAEAHRDHVLNSPFTCFDWQRSQRSRRASLAEVFPVFALQPRHFFSRRRGIEDYLRDLRERAITYRELSFDDGYREIKRQKAMNARDLHEFAYHVMRFLMQNFIKLVERRNETPEGESLLAGYTRHLPADMEVHGPLYLDLARRKKEGDFTLELDDLTARVAAFVGTFHSQFTAAFHDAATRHVVFRHLPTALNQSGAEGRTFQGRIDPPLEDAGSPNMERIVAALKEIKPRKFIASPLRRATATLERVSTAAGCSAKIERDERLVEIDYGACDGMTVAAARRDFPELFQAWERGEDPPFPGGGENTAEVLHRLENFVCQRWQPSNEPSAVCTHNVVLRCLLGKALAIPQPLWYLLEIPHDAPIFVVATRRFGWFVEIEEEVQRKIFERFYCRSSR